MKFQYQCRLDKILIHNANGTINISLTDKNIHGLDRVTLEIVMNIRHLQIGDGIRFLVRSSLQWHQEPTSLPAPKPFCSGPLSKPRRRYVNTKYPQIGDGIRFLVRPSS